MPHPTAHAQPHKPLLSQAQYRLLRDAMLPILREHDNCERGIPRDRLLDEVLDQLPDLGNRETADRRMREAARLMIERDHIPVCTVPDGGYYLPATPEDADPALRVLGSYRRSFGDREDNLRVALAHWFAKPVQMEMRL